MPEFVAVPAKEICPGSYHETRDALTVLMQPFFKREYWRLLLASGVPFEQEHWKVKLGCASSSVAAWGKSMTYEADVLDPCVHQKTAPKSELFQALVTLATVQGVVSGAGLSP
jgi:hypothetical protein